MPDALGFPSDDGVPSQGWKLYLTSLVMILPAGVTVFARCTTRLIARQLGSDDYAIICALLSSVVLSVAIQRAVTHGYGMHKTDLTPQQLHTSLRWFFIAQTPYKVTVCLNKLSAVLFYRRIFIDQRFQTICWISMAFIVSWSIGAVAATIWQCVPIEGSWNKSVKARCIDSDSFWVAYAVMNILTDGLVLSLPLPQVFALQLKLRERVMLCGVFLLGSFVLIAGILRTTAVQSSLAKQSDLTWNFIPRGIWTLIEANLGIISACLPILKKPFSSALSRVLGTTRPVPSAYTRPTGSRSLHKRMHSPSNRIKSGKVHDGVYEAEVDSWKRKDSDVELISSDTKQFSAGVSTPVAEQHGIKVSRAFSVRVQESSRDAE